MLEIATDKIGHVIIRAREIDGKVAAWDDQGNFDQDDKDADSIIEDLPGDATRQELQEFLQSLNEDELASLIALAWIGRGTYAPEELNEAIATAKTDHSTNAELYLLRLPLLGDYLEEAMDTLGLSPGEVEQDIIKPV